jgi:hypothetical protein
MNAEEFAKLLHDLDACEEARSWAEGKDWPTVYRECPRGDWLHWLFKTTHPERYREAVLVSGYYANTMRSHMRDPRSKAAVDAAIAFGESRIDLDEYVNIVDEAWIVNFNAQELQLTKNERIAAQAAIGINIGVNQNADICRAFLPFETWEF